MLSRVPSFKSARRFRRDQHGSIAIIFGLSLLLIIFAIGFSLDTAQAIRTSSKIASALDAASLAVARAMSENNLTPAEAQALAVRYFEAEVSGIDAGSFTWSNFKVEIDPVTGTVKIAADIAVPTSFARVLDVNNVNFTKSSTTVFKMRNVELAMVLDITGSMSGQKIADLKLAADDIVDIMLPAGKPSMNRIALAPYAASVNAGAYAAVATDNESLDGCAIERKGSHAYTDEAPDSGRYLEAEKSPPVNWRKYKCPLAEIMPLNSDAAAIKAEIDSLVADGSTAGHIGLGWGWYMVSPLWTPIWPTASDPKPYDDPNTIKAIILMTDGEFNTSYHNGPMNQTSSDQALEICNNIKDPGFTKGNLTVYSVAFQSPPAAEATLKACATSPAHYFSASNGTELRAAFQDIAKRLQSLRLAK